MAEPVEVAGRQPGRERDFGKMRRARHTELHTPRNIGGTSVAKRNLFVKCSRWRVLPSPLWRHSKKICHTLKPYARVAELRPRARGLVAHALHAHRRRDGLPDGCGSCRSALAPPRAAKLLLECFRAYQSEAEIRDCLIVGGARHADGRPGSADDRAPRPACSSPEAYVTRARVACGAPSGGRLWR